MQLRRASRDALADVGVGMGHKLGWISEAVNAMNDPIQNGIQFHGEPKLVPHTDGVHWTVDEDYLVHDPILGDLLVPKGFVTDLGSIPKVFQNIISPEGKPLRAYLIHDALYDRQTCTKEEADLCLKRLMVALGVPEIEIESIYEAVKMFGQASWDADARKEK